MTAPPSKALGATKDVNELIPGHVDHTRDIAEDLGKEAERVGGMYDEFHAISVESWAGVSQDAWEEAVGIQSDKWKAYVSLLTVAQGAVSTYADGLDTAQSRGRQAIEMWDEAEGLTADAIDTYNAAIRQYNKDVEDCVVGARPPAEFTDPGEPLRQEAIELVATARADLDAAGQAALVALGMLEGGNSGSSTETTGADGDVSGPGFSWESWERHYGRDPLENSDASQNDDGDPEWELQLGQVEGSIFALHHEGSYQDYVLGGNVLVSANGSYTLGQAETHATVGVTDDGLEVAVGVSINAFSADGQLTASTWLMSGQIGVQAAGGAHADASVTIGPGGVHAEGEVFAGVEVDFQAALELGGVGAEGNAGFSFGVGAEADGQIGMVDGEFRVGGSVGVALGPGLELGFTITLDPDAVMDTISDGSGWFGEGIWKMGQAFRLGGH